MKISIFWDITPCSPLKVKPTFREERTASVFKVESRPKKQIQYDKTELDETDTAMKAYVPLESLSLPQTGRKCAPEDLTSHYCEKLMYHCLCSSFNVTRPSFTPIQNNRCKYICILIQF
jgi:hypothetical protein